MKLLVSYILTFSSALIGSLVTYPAISAWYAELNKPPFNPPNWIFGPVWTFLYVLMGASLYLFWRAKNKKSVVKKGLLFFGTQLALNTVWSILFFGLKNPFLAIVDIIALWSMILLTIHHFRKTSSVAGWLLVPYLAWVTFASVLNYFIWVLN